MPHTNHSILPKIETLDATFIPGSITFNLKLAGPGVESIIEHGVLFTFGGFNSEVIVPEQTDFKIVFGSQAASDVCSVTASTGATFPDRVFYRGYAKLIGGSFLYGQTKDLLLMP